MMMSSLLFSLSLSLSLFFSSSWRGRRNRKVPPRPPQRRRTERRTRATATRNSSRRQRPPSKSSLRAVPVQHGASSLLLKHVDDTQLFPLKIKKNEKLHCIRARNTLPHKTESLKIRCDALKADGGGCEALFFIVICGLFAAANFNAQSIIKTCCFVYQL